MSSLFFFYKKKKEKRDFFKKNEYHLFSMLTLFSDVCGFQTNYIIPNEVDNKDLIFVFVIISTYF